MLSSSWEACALSRTSASEGLLDRRHQVNERFVAEHFYNACLDIDGLLGFGVRGRRPS